MKSSVIYINPQGVPCAPTRNIPDELVTNEKFHHIQWGSVAFKKEIINSCIPIREEDQYDLMKQVWKIERDADPYPDGTFFERIRNVAKLDTFYSVEPYEFEVDRFPTATSATCNIVKARIVRHSESKDCTCTGVCLQLTNVLCRDLQPKADPKEKELNREYAEKLILWLNSNGFLTTFAKGHSAAYFLLEFESYLERQSKTKDI